MSEAKPVEQPNALEQSLLEVLIARGQFSKIDRPTLIHEVRGMLSILREKAQSEPGAPAA